MDRLSQADAVLAAVASHSPAVLLPGRVVSPMDCQATMPVAREVVDGCEARAAREAVPPSPDPVMDEEMLRLSGGRNAPRPRRDSA